MGIVYIKMYLLAKYKNTLDENITRTTNKNFTYQNFKFGNLAKKDIKSFIFASKAIS
jgi:hypothetical protein